MSKGQKRPSMGRMRPVSRRPYAYLAARLQLGLLCFRLNYAVGGEDTSIRLGRAQQILVGTQRCNAALTKYDDQIRPPDLGQAMRDQEGSAAFRRVPDR